MGCLDDVRIASPCPARWGQMKGDDRVRFCGHCKKNVYDFSELTGAEILRLLAREPKPCARLWRRPDGKLLTADCRVGLARARVRLAAAVLTAASFFLGFFGVRAFLEVSRQFVSAGGLEPLPSASYVPATLVEKKLARFGQDTEP